jgi:hypothetical protein
MKIVANPCDSAYLVYAIGLLRFGLHNTVAG